MELLEAIQQSQMLYRLGWALIHTVWLGAGVALVFAIVLVILRRRSANARYLAGCAALVMMAALPLVIFVGAGPPRSAFQEAESAEPVGHTVSVEPAALPLDADGPQPVPAGADDPIQAAADAPLLARATQALEPAVPWIVLTWAAGVFLLSIWQLGGWLAAERLRRVATQPGGTDVIGTVVRLAHAMRVSRPVKVLVSTLVRVPTVVGWLRPVILMPAGLATGLAPQQLQAVLAHELAHIRRYDYLVNLLQSLVETLLFYHPAVWFISRRIRAERENCCDDMAVAAGAEPLSYAESLVRVARRSAAPAGRGRPAVALGLGATGRPSQLGGRIRRLLGAGGEETGRFSRGWPIALAFLGALLAGTCLSMNVEAETAGRTEKAGSPAPTGVAPKGASTQPAAKGGGVAWGKAVGGVQVGIGLFDPSKSSYRIGQEAGFSCHARNVTGKTIKLSLLETGARAWHPHVGNGKISLPGLAIVNGRVVSLRTLSLPPGKAVPITTAWFLIVEPDWVGETDKALLRARPGKYAVTFSLALDLGHSMSKAGELVSGELALEIVPASAEELRKLAEKYPPPKVAATKAAQRFLMAVRNSDEKALDELTLKLAGKVEQMRQEWKKRAAEIRRAYAAAPQRLTEIRALVGLPESTPMFGTAGARIDGAKGPNDRYLWLLLERSPSGWRVRHAADSDPNVPLKQTLLNHLRAPAGEPATQPAGTSPKGASTRPAGKAAFGPVMERLVSDDGEGKDCLIDLDTGRLYSPPRHVKGKDKIAAWFREKGIDAGAETNPAGAGLWGLEMVVIPVASKLWDEDPLVGIRDEFEHGKPGTPAVMSALGQLPRTYAFKTREGGIGVLQVLEVNNATRPRHIKIRWKMLKAARPRAPVTQPAGKSALEISDIRFDPIGQEKNTLHVKVRNTSGKKQTVAVHIYTRRRTGWGQPAFAVLEPRQTRPMSIPFVINEPVTDQTWIRLRVYNPASAAKYDYQDERILEKRYEAGGLRRRAAAKAGLPASKDKAEEIKKAFLEIQAHVRGGKFKQAWQCLTKDYRKLAYYDFSSFEKTMTESPLFLWSAPQLLELRPQQVTQRDGVQRLAATREGQTWTIDFVREDGRWKIEWVRGYTRRIDRWVYWQKRLLPKMQKHTTKHFDVYCFKGSTAEKEIDKILKEKEAGHEKICEFLGRKSDVKIRLVLFEDKRTKHLETGHQGMGWATGTTIVEVYGDEGKLDPYHETAHILMRFVGSPPAILNEGFAVYMSERLGAPALKNLGGDKLSVYAKAKQVRQNGKWIPLQELLTYTEIGSRQSRSEVSYPQAGAFVKFLIDKHGKDKFLQAYKALKNSSEPAVRQRNRQTLEKICGQSLKRLESDWVKAVMSTR